MTKLATWTSQTNQVTKRFLGLANQPEIINLGGGLPAPEVYPVEALSRLASEAILFHQETALGYGAIDGLPALREAIAQAYSTTKLSLTRENVLIVAGAMQALDLIGKVLVNPGEEIAVQCPTYMGAIDTWLPREPRYRDVRLDSDIPLTDQTKGVKFLYTVPNFSNPTGVLIGLETRQALAQFANDSGIPLIEDDPYGTLYYDSPPLPSILSLSGEGQPYRGNVIYLGTVSKTIAPGLRVGWVIARPEIIEVLTIAKQGTDLCTSSLSQCIVLAALEKGLIAEQVPTILDLYRERRDTLCQGLTENLSEWFTWQKPVGGMFVWLNARDQRIDTTELIEYALDSGVCFSPSEVFDPVSKRRNGIRLNFTLNPPDALLEATVRMGQATEKYLEDKR
ncbi:MAG: PLP-dependent aminotransferase family protein [Chloroflexota bacterium]